MMTSSEIFAICLPDNFIMELSNLLRFHNEGKVIGTKEIFDFKKQTMLLRRYGILAADVCAKRKNLI